MKRLAALALLIAAPSLVYAQDMGGPTVTPAQLNLKVDKAGDTMTGDLNMSGADIVSGDNDMHCYGDAPDWCQYFNGTRMLGVAQVANVGFHILNLGASSATSEFFEINGGAIDTRFSLVSTGSNSIMELRAAASMIGGFRLYQGASLKAVYELTAAAQPDLLIRLQNSTGSILFGNPTTNDVLEITDGVEAKFNDLVVFQERDTTAILQATDRITVFNNSIPVAGSGGAVTLTSTPTITAPATVGTRVTLWGTSDTNLVTIRDADNLAGTGLKLNNDVDFTLGLDDNIVLEYKSSGFWCEVGGGRTDN